MPLVGFCRITGWLVGVGRDLYGQGHLAVEQIVPSLARPGLECFKGWSTHHLSLQPVPVFYHPHHEKFPLYI